MTIILSLLTLSLFTCVVTVHAIDPRFTLDPGILQKNLSNKEAPSAQLRKKEAPRPRSGETVYTVKQGDNLLKILVHDMGIGRKRAKILIPEIKRRNRIEGNAKLEAGAKIIIPLQEKTGKLYTKNAHYIDKKRLMPPGREIVAHRLSLRVAQESTRDVIKGARIVWDKLLPAKQSDSTTYSINGKSFSLDLDPAKFPVFATVTGDKIIVDMGGNMSSIVKSLIEQHDSHAKLISYNLGDKTGFYSDLLNAAGFYSVEKNFSVSFGTDPKLTVNSDFKVENDPDSLLQHDIFLINTARGKGGFPNVLDEFMAQQGFKVINVSPPHISDEKGRNGDAINVITEKEPNVMMERLLKALKLSFEKNRMIDLYNMGEAGIGLRIKADYYFERYGKKYVVSVFKGDPEEYTLLRLLDSLNYHVLILDPKEDFRSITSKMIAKLDLSGKYAMYDLLPVQDVPYGIQMSGIMIDAPKRAGKIFLAETRPDPVITELLKINGYIIRNADR